MRRKNINDYQAFIAVAREQSFTKAAAQLGVSQSALSYTIRTLEAHLGIRLLTRSTRSVSVTEAGERLLSRIGPHFDQIEDEIAALSGMREKPAGTVRITSVEHAAETLLWPKLAPMLLKYPDINIEIISEYGLKDIVAERYDAGVRLGEQVDKDMISLPLAENFSFAVVGSPSYLKRKAVPVIPSDLSHHSCIKLRLPTLGSIYTWEFYKEGNEIKVRVDGQGTFATISMMRQAALDSLGLAYLPKDTVDAELKNGKLVQVLADWCPPRPAYHLYYPSRKQHSRAFMLVLDALRYPSV
ncbi:LysR-family transcriptional regulator [Pectobacterium atrosepticum SCRI1043]|uniref:LysR-family transcriptional regulator n=1 Tax=Pectobacterium atrosepticum (strain SCRI 1043 / ATCC BAA-672) TaxID=218491 RepID=Q6D509_PECAS|nr:LysR family transcriptional regulator [Pectobacterium atrosepticum]GKV85420.1 LysR family transcriptional regulator [Pectobacterium carotovorum subsp. carotovorum]AIA71043.1 LysR family transcriptional regulator [Pectobacterium atrosepticum]AIK14131.1 LysR-family transcriptional regulator [Pectobacterium atrosepticum]ATY90948.1 LysR family transcriptional regulator [Pectobacterium atrosepticum]KFX14172.1 LysR family transcriptional regulator [Pectobacterium atrosepticum]